MKTITFNTTNVLLKVMMHWKLKLIRLKNNDVLLNISFYLIYILFAFFQKNTQNFQTEAINCFEVKLI